MTIRTKMIIAVVALAVLITLFFVLLRKKPVVPVEVKNPIQNSDLLKTQIGDIKYTGLPITPPKSLAVYSNEGITLENLEKELALRFGFSQSSFSKTVWLSKDNKESLVLDSFNNNIQYSIDQSGQAGKEPRPTLSDSKKRASEFLSSIGLSKTISQEPDSVNYYKGSELAVVTAEEADFIGLSFKQKVSGLPVSIDTFTFSDINVLTGTESRVVKTTFPPRLTPSVSKGEFPVIDFNTAVATVEAKKGSLVEVRMGDLGKQKAAASLSNVLLSSAVLEYRLSTKDNLFYPYYRFEGTGVIPDNKIGEVIFIVPAIAIP